MDLKALVDAITKLEGEDLKKVQKALKVEAESKSRVDDESIKRFKQLGLEADEAASAVERLKLAETEYLDLQARIAQRNGDNIKFLKNMSKLYDETVAKLDMLEQAYVDVENLSQEQVEQRAKERQEILKRIDATGFEIDTLRDLKLQYEQLSPVYEEAVEKGEELSKGFATAVSKVFPMYSRAFTGILKKSKEYLEIVKTPGGFQGLLDGARKVINVKNIMIAVTGQVILASLQLAMAADKASAAFAAQTGAGREMTAVISNVAGANRNLGLSAELAGKAATDLYENFSGFMQLGQGAQESLTETVALLGRIGIDGATAAKTLTLFNKNMGLSIHESERLTKQLAMMGTEIGISSSKMVKGFAEASKSLAVYGKGAVKVFSDMAAQAKAANVEVGTLMGLAEKFDTFEGAANSAGKLNAILGTNISATEMLNMKENERIETLIRSIQAQGIAFKDMDRFSQKAVANAAGISDMAEAQRIFGMSVNDYRKGLKGNVEEEKFQQALKDTMDIMEKLKKIGQSFAISLKGTIDVVAGFLQKILDLNDLLQGYLIPTVFVVVTTMVALGKVFALLAPLLPAIGTGSGLAAPGLAALGKALGSNVVNFVKGGAGLAVVGIAMGIFAIGIAKMASSMGAGGSIGMFLGELAVGLVALGGAFLVLGLMVAGPQGLIFAAGLTAAASSIAAIGLAISDINGEKLKNLADIFNILAGREIKAGATISFATDLKSFTDALINKEAVLKPMLGDLALIATGKTTQAVTTSATAYNFQQFSAKFDNIFQPKITVKIGEKELKHEIMKTQRDQ